MQLVELAHRMTADDEVDAGVEAALGHEADAGGLGRLCRWRMGLP